MRCPLPVTRLECELPARATRLPTTDPSSHRADAGDAFMDAGGPRPTGARRVESLL